MSADGYSSLLVKSEGGRAEEIVSEENGILISMMLRQYFMALRVMDQWMRWGPSLDRHWGAVVSNLDKTHPSMPPSPVESRRTAYFDQDLLSQDQTQQTLPNGSSGWNTWTPSRIRDRRASLPPLDEHIDHGEEDHDDQRSQRKEQSVNEEVDTQLRTMRRVVKKWCRIAGVHGKACDALQEGEFTCEWTRAIAPRIEGRIKNIREGYVAGRSEVGSVHKARPPPHEDGADPAERPDRQTNNSTF